MAKAHIGLWQGELKMHWVFFIPGKLMDLYFSLLLLEV
jgi:hypothetical protein